MKLYFFFSLTYATSMTTRYYNDCEKRSSIWRTMFNKCDIQTYYHCNLIDTGFVTLHCDFVTSTLI